MQRVGIDAQGAHLSALRRDGGGPGIVFLHGLCGGAIHFDRAFTAPSLDGANLLAFDIPGFGESSPQGGLDAMADALATGLATWGFRRPLLVAHSMASSLAARLLSYASGVVLLEGNLLVQHLEFSDRIIGVPRDSFTTEYARMQRTSKMILRYQTRISDDTALAQYARTWAACSADTVWEVAAEINAEIRAGDVVSRFAAAGVPLTCVFGTDGAYAKTMNELKRKLPSASAVPVANAAHYPMLDAPEETYTVIADVYMDISRYA